MKVNKVNADYVREKLAMSQDISEEWEYKELQKEDIDGFITGAIGLFCVVYEDRIEYGYYSKRYDCHFIIRAYPNFTFSIAGWIVEEGEKDD